VQHQHEDDVERQVEPVVQRGRVRTLLEPGPMLEL
jgi:hypothetical protein